jgi:hypothetical protein
MGEVVSKQGGNKDNHEHHFGNNSKSITMQFTHFIGLPNGNNDLNVLHRFPSWYI